MPVHDWTRVGTWLFHHFHTTWLTHLAERLNAGLLPDGYKAYTEQRAELYIPDLLALTAALPTTPAPRRDGGVAVAEPRVARRVTATTVPQPPIGRALTVRHASHNRIVAVLEVVSPRNKDRGESVGDFAGKLAGFVRVGVHAALIDLLPPGRHDPGGMHPAVWALLDDEVAGDPAPADQPFTFAGYQAERLAVAHLNYAAVGEPIPSIPLFLDGGLFVELPLEETYMTGFTRLPAVDRRALGE